MCLCPKVMNVEETPSGPLEREVVVLPSRALCNPDHWDSLDGDAPTHKCNALTFDRLSQTRSFPYITLSVGRARSVHRPTVCGSV